MADWGSLNGKIVDIVTLGIESYFKKMKKYVNSST